MSLKYQILLIIIMVAVLPIIILGSVAAGISTRIITEKEASIKINILSEISLKLHDSLERRMIASIDFMLDRDVNDPLSGNNELSDNEMIKIGFEVEKKLQDYRDLQGTYSISLYTVGGKIYSNFEAKSPPLEFYKEQPWFQKAIIEDDISFWGDMVEYNGTRFVPHLRVIKKSGTDNIIGFFIAQYRESFFQDMYDNFVISGLSEYGIVNSRGQIFSHSNANLLMQNYNEHYGKVEADGIDNSESGYYYSDNNAERYLTIFFDDIRTGWLYINSVPDSEIKKSSKYISRVMLYLSFFLIIVCIVLAVILSANIILPLKDLIFRMERAKQGDWNIEITPKRSGEIGALEQKFNYMIKVLKQSIDDLMLSQKQKRKAELNALEMQINPHFLYNTMSSIIWLSDKRDHESVIRIAEALSTLFRISINKGKEVITVGEELLHVRSFIKILQIRYVDKFEYNCKVDERLLDLKTIKLILQPIVENAVYHGIKKQKSSDFNGLIDLSARKVDDILEFCITDNGGELSSFEAVKLNSFLSDPKGYSSEYGIGIRNVHDRIQLAYGSNYGIEFKAGKGLTSVYIRIPVRKRENENEPI